MCRPRALAVPGTSLESGCGRFYLAQSYRDFGEREQALEHYLIRAELGFWQEEVFISLYCAAPLEEQLDHPEDEVVAAYLRAADALPSRVEALHGASRFCRFKARYEEATGLPNGGLEFPCRRTGSSLNLDLRRRPAG
jgi:hypothetical protein